MTGHMRCRALLLAAAIATATAATLGTPTATAEDFPVRAQLTGGPAAYRTGDRPRGLSIRLSNTTRTARRDVHPVMVLVDRERALKPGSVSLQYRDPASGGGTWREVELQHTENDENVGVVGGEEGPGLTLGAGESVTVRLRMRFGSGTRPGHVAASATVMQRKGKEDGEWVGESAPYEFEIVAPPAEPGPGTGPDPGPGPGAGPGTGTGPGPGPGPESGPRPGPEREWEWGSEPERAGPWTPPEAPRPLPELAATGVALRAAARLAAALLLGGATLVLVVRRRD